MLDVVIAGAGPAGATAAWVAARAGARVLIVDRDQFPRDKLCGDTLNPGALALLRSIGLDNGLAALGRPIGGMRVTGAGATVDSRYQPDRQGLAVTRRVFDGWLLERAIAAGAHFEPGLIVRRPLVDESAGRPVVRGLVLARRGDSDTVMRMPGSVTIAADGRASVIARALNLSSVPARPRRWAFGTYVSGVAGVSDLGEMHVAAGRYIGIARVSDDIANVCVVTGPRPDGPTPLDVMRRAIASEPRIRARFERARFDAPVRVLGPLAMDVRAAGADGVLLAGDAAGFVDPMTGDGISLAMHGAVLAAREALGLLESGDYVGAVERLTAARRKAIGTKQRFDRLVRRLVESPAALTAAGLGARVAPGLVRWAVRYAGDAA
jgi:flavin-dependent dehydrogenase